MDDRRSSNDHVTKFKIMGPHHISESGKARRFKFSRNTDHDDKVAPNGEC